jgi:hypothetical protein
MIASSGFALLAMTFSTVIASEALSREDEVRGEKKS